MSQRIPPGPKNTLTTLRDFNANRLEFLMRAHQDYGDIVHLPMPGRHAYVLNHPDLIRYVLVEAPEKFHKGTPLKRNTRDSIGDGLLTSEDDFHRRQRRLVQPAFHVKRVAAYADIMTHYTEQMLDGWNDGRTLDIHEAMMKLTMSIVARALFNADLTDDADEIGRAITIAIEFVGERIGRMVNPPTWLPTRKNKIRAESAAVVDAAVNGMIQERRVSGEDGVVNDVGDLLSMLLLSVDEDGERMTDKQVRDEAMTLFIAGHETTANALTWTLYLLSPHPEVEMRLAEELDRVLGGRLPTFADVPQLAYTEKVIKEAMRLYPPAWIMSRRTVEAVTIGGYAIPRNSAIIISPYVMHHDPRYFDEPERFNPERFDADFDQRVPRYAYFPFGGGPRICIGNAFAMMEAQVVLATMVQRCRLSLVPGQQIMPRPLVTLRPKGQIQMRVEVREAIKA